MKHEWIVCVALGLAGCGQSPPAPVVPVEAPTKPVVSPSAEPEPGSAIARTEQVKVFDPAHPPPGFSRCQGGDCVAADGRVLSFRQVMAEVGATRIAGQIEEAKLPPAPADVSAPPPSAEKTATGLASRVLRAGTGTVHPGPTSTVQVHYSGWTTDGEAFDSSMARGRPAGFPLNRVIAGWQEVIQLMVVGESRRVWIPEALAYQGKPHGPSGMLVFDIELLAIPTP